MTLLQRAQAPTPKFFQKVRTGGLLLATLGGALMAAHAALPPWLLKFAGYLTVAGSVAAAVSQVTTNPDDTPAKGDGNGNG